MWQHHRTKYVAASEQQQPALAVHQKACTQLAATPVVSESSRMQRHCCRLAAIRSPKPAATD
jgi:hypothetical protein